MPACLSHLLACFQHSEWSGYGASTRASYLLFSCFFSSCIFEITLTLSHFLGEKRHGQTGDNFLWNDRLPLTLHTFFLLHRTHLLSPPLSLPLTLPAAFFTSSFSSPSVFVPLTPGRKQTSGGIYLTLFGTPLARIISSPGWLASSAPARKSISYLLISSGRSWNISMSSSPPQLLAHLYILDVRPSGAWDRNIYVGLYLRVNMEAGDRLCCVFLPR